MKIKKVNTVKSPFQPCFRYRSNRAVYMTSASVLNDLTSHCSVWAIEKRRLFCKGITLGSTDRMRHLIKNRSDIHQLRDHTHTGWGNKERQPSLGALAD